jgi:cytochrome c-type biogenesis protein CcmH
MFGFYLSAGAMTVMVAVVLLQALRRAGTEAAPTGAEDLIIYRDQLAEVDRDLARGVLPPEEAGRLRTEVQRRILEAGRSQPDGPNRKASHPALAGSAVVLAVILSGVIYLSLGAPETFEPRQDYLLTWAPDQAIVFGREGK